MQSHSSIMSHNLASSALSSELRPATAGGYSDSVMTTIEEVHVGKGRRLSYYRNDYRLAPLINEMCDSAARLSSIFKIDGHQRRLFMVNSTAKGGGVAEMLPACIQFIRIFGIECHWFVLTPPKTSSQFFDFTKRLHNMIHGVGVDCNINSSMRSVYEKVSREAAEKLATMVSSGDVIVLHDPQTVGMALYLRQLTYNVTIVFRCHIGVEFRNNCTCSAWEFLKPYAKMVDVSVFTAAEYIPEYLHAAVISPGIDPTSDKNMELSPMRLMTILVNAGLVPAYHPVAPLNMVAGVQRLNAIGEWAPALEVGEVGFMFRPIICQISRWDRLKGFLPLLRAFILLKQRQVEFASVKTRSDGHHEHEDVRAARLKHVRLMLAGPDPRSIQDDPEGQEVLDELRETYMALEAHLQADVAILTLPMESRKHNALIVNAIQRCSTVIVQNSLQEGFGLTCTEAMWKALPIVATQACGLRRQIVDGVHGRLVRDPTNEMEVAQALNDVLDNLCASERQGLKAQQRSIKEFTVFGQVTRWFELFNRAIGKAEPFSPGEVTGTDESSETDSPKTLP